MARKSRWTTIYWDDQNSPDGKCRPYVRLSPRFMDLENTQFTHGLAIGADPLDDNKDAGRLANSIDVFMDEMIKEYDLRRREDFPFGWRVLDALYDNRDMLRRLFQSLKNQLWKQPKQRDRAVKPGGTNTEEKTSPSGPTKSKTAPPSAGRTKQTTQKGKPASKRRTRSGQIREAPPLWSSD